MNSALSPLEVFRRDGVPHRRIEDWKYSDLRSVLDAETVARAPGVLLQVENLASEIESVDLTSDILPSWATRLIQEFPRDDAMDAAAWAFAASGIALRVPRGARIAQPVTLAFQGLGHGRVIIALEEGASLTFIENHRERGEGLRNLSVAIVLEDGAELIHVRNAEAASALISVETIAVRIGRDANYRVHLASGGAKLSRTEFHVTLAGEGANADLNGVTVLGGDAHADVTTRIDHAVCHTTSRQLFKIAAGGRSRAVYQGKIIVHEGADGSDSRQTAKALLLGARAEADLKPELEIFADDVKCAHGAAAGDLDADSLFYLRARGIPESDARSLLIRAFLDEAVDEIEDESMRASTRQFVESGLSAALQASP